MTSEDTYPRLVALVQARVEHGPANPKNIDDSFAALGFDSLSMAELSLAIEQEFGIRLGEDVLDIISMQELTKYVDKLLAKKAGK